MKPKRVLAILSLLAAMCQQFAFAQAPDDHGNQPETSTAVPLNATVSGEIGAAGDIDYFKLVVPTHIQLRLRILTIGSGTAPTSFRVSAELQDVFLTPIASTTDAAVFDYKPPAIVSLVEGVYYVKVAGAQGAYQLVLESKEDDHGDTQATATQIQLGSTLRGTIGFEPSGSILGSVGFGDVDYFSVWIPTGGRLYLGLASNSLAREGGFSVEPLGGGPLTVYYSFEAPSDLFVQVGRGRYFFRADGRLGATSYSATPRFVTSQPTAEDDVGGSTFDARNLPLNATVSSVIDSPGDMDSWRLEIPATGKLRIDVIGATSYQGALVLPSFKLVPSSAVIAFRGGLESTFASVLAGTYFLEVYSGPTGLTGPYTIRAQFMADVGAPVDDHANTPGAASRVEVGAAIQGSLDYEGDVDVFRIVVPADGSVTIRSTGGANLAGWLTSTTGAMIVSNDDAEMGSRDFGFTQYLASGTYFLHLAGAPGVRGRYEVLTSLFPASHNFTDLWWNATESGWGLNLNHQGDTLFATLFVYDAEGTGLWLVMSSGRKESFGTYSGTLYRTSGPAFNSPAWGSTAVTPVGTMQLVFNGKDSGELTYTVNGATVRKSITRQRFGTAPGCTFSAFDRSYSTNYQDLWWNPTEPGWGVNLTHQGNILFATLFTYDASGKPLWLVMSRGTRAGDQFSGDLFRVRGSPFNSNIWVPVTTTKVGTLSVTFSNGNAGRLEYSVDGVSVSKAIVRQVFGSPATFCG